MSNENRRSYAKPEFVLSHVGLATVIEAGDQLWYDESAKEVKPASDFAFTVDLPQTQAPFKLKFAGVSMDASAAGEAENIRVACDSACEMDADSAEFNPNTLVGPALNGTSDGLENQKVAIVATEALAVGRALEHGTVTKPLVHFVGEVFLAYSKKPSA